METRKRPPACVVLCVSFCLLAGAAAAANGAAEEAGAPVYPVNRVYPLVAVDVETKDGPPTAENWAKAFPGEGFFSKGVIEKEGARTVFRMLRGKDRLYVLIECNSRGTAEKKESVEFYVTQAGKPDFPCVAVTLNEDGEGIVGLARRAHTWWISPHVFPLDEKVIPRQVSATENGWKVEFSLPFDELDIPREGFRFDVVHGLADGERFAWCDLGGREGTSNQFDVYARASSAEKVGFPENGLRLPAAVSVGLNQVPLERPDPDLTLQTGAGVFKPGDDGVFDAIVHDRGPLDMRLADADGKVIASYHADVRRPLIIDAKERYLPADAGVFDLDISLRVAGEKETDVVVTCRRGDGAPERHEVSLKPGDHTLKLPVPGGEEDEVRVTAEASVPLTEGAPPLTLDARHWFAVGVSREDVDVYREGTRSLPTDRIYWAALADAMPRLLLSQSGDGAYGRKRRSRWSRLWPQMCVYPVALLYKTEHPDNPFFGDRRLLDSAVMGMEYSLRPEIRIDEYAIPDSRSPQAFLLTYELLKDDIEPERRAYWAGELQHIADAEVGRFLRRIVDKYTFYSVDCETSTNHMSYHVANVYLAGVLFDRKDWRDLGTMLMRRLARRGSEGYFEEQKGSPPNHYTWLTANALGEYYQRSKDAEVLPTLQACARYMAAITTPEGGTMALHDSRTSFHHPYRFGDFVLSRSPEGRRAARARLLGMMRDRPSRVSQETLCRLAENAVYYTAGPEEDLFGGDRELAFSHGILVRKDGFQYGLSTVARGGVQGHYRLDAQNVIEMLHKDAGCILHGGNSQSQPEAGNFFRKLDEPDWEGKTVATSNDYLPKIASVAAIPGGHDLRLGYRTFDAHMTVRVLSPTLARIKAVTGGSPGPVTFNFFPGVRNEEELTVGDDGRSVRFRQVTFRADRPFKVQKGFRMLNPYNMEYSYTHKPVRCWFELQNDETFVLDIHVTPE